MEKTRRLIITVLKSVTSLGLEMPKSLRFCHLVVFAADEFNLGYVKNEKLARGRVKGGVF